MWLSYETQKSVNTKEILDIYDFFQNTTEIFLKSKNKLNRLNC